MSNSLNPRPTLRAAAATAATVIGIGAVVGYGAVASENNDPAATAASASTESQSSDSNSTSGDSKSTSTDSNSDSSTDSNSGTTDTNSSNSGSTSNSSTSSDGTWEGAVYNTPYGPMQVSATISGGKITSVDWLQLPSDRHSQRINDYAAPQLVQEALEVQSANVTSISGASYTSEGFKNSLQAALDDAGL